MQDLTRKEFFLLGLYALLVLVGLRWLAGAVFEPGADLPQPLEQPALRATASAPEPVALDPTEAATVLCALRARFVHSESSNPLGGRARLLAGEELLGAGELDSEGRLDLEGLSAGEATLELELIGRAPYRRRLTLAAGEIVDLGTIPLALSTALVGRVVREDDLPAAFPLLVQSLSQAGQADGMEPALGRGASRLTYSQEDGRFEIQNCSPGDWVVRIPGPDEGIPSPTLDALASRARIVHLDADGAPSLELQAEPTLRVQCRTGAARGRSLGYVLLEEAGIALRRGMIGADGPPAFELVAGAYRLRLFDLEGSLGELTFQVAGGPPGNAAGAASADIVLDLDSILEPH
jgi:hypothetical protein